MILVAGVVVVVALFLSIWSMVFNKWNFIKLNILLVCSCHLCFFSWWNDVLSWVAIAIDFVDLFHLHRSISLFLRFECYSSQCVRASTKYYVTNMRCGNDGWNCSILWYLEDELIVIIWYIHSPRRFHLWLEWSFNVCLFEYVWFQMGAISSGFSKTEIPIFDSKYTVQSMHSL